MVAVAVVPLVAVGVARSRGPGFARSGRGCSYCTFPDSLVHLDRLHVVRDLGRDVLAVVLVLVLERVQVQLSLLVLEICNPPMWPDHAFVSGDLS